MHSKPFPNHAARFQDYCVRPAPFHPIARGRAGPGLLAHILFAKYGLHLPLNRQSEVYAWNSATKGAKPAIFGC